MPHGTRAGHEVFWRETGHGPERALFLHCALAHSGAWVPVLERLDGINAVLPDMPGHGRSAEWDGRGDIFDTVYGIAGCFLEPGCHLVGHSFGAVTALRLALTHPDRVRSLVLIEPVLFCAAKDSAPEIFAAYCDWGQPLAQAMTRKDWPLAAERFTTAWGSGPAWDAMSDAQRAGYARQMPLVAATQPALMDDTAGLLQPGRLERLEMPVLLLRGDRTMPIMAAVHQALAQRIAGARDAVIAGAGHMLPMTHARQVAAQIGALLARAPAC